MLSERLAVKIGDQTLEYHDMGARGGPALVLLHGGQCTADDWAPVVDQLSRHYRLILPDGFVYPLDAWNVWQLLDHVGIVSAALMGHSAGGRVARPMYCLRPRRVWAIVAVDSDTAGELQLARRLPNDRYSPTAAALYEQHRAQVQQLKPSHQGDYPSTVTIERRMEAYRRAGMTPEQRRAWRPPARLVGNIEPAPAPQPIEETGKFITCPTLVVQTGRGKIGPEDMGPEYAQQHFHAADVRHVVIKEAGHWPWIEDPAGFLALLEPFLEQAQRAAAHARPA